MAYFPKEGIWKQGNLGDKFQDIVASKNLELTKKFGSLKISPRLLLNVGTSDLANLDVAPFAIVYVDDDSKWYVGAGDDIFIGDNLPNESFSEFSPGSGDPSMENTARPDLAYFNDFLFAMSSELYRLDDNSADWDTITSLGGSLGGAPLIPFGATGRLYYRITVDQMGSIQAAAEGAETPVAPTAQYALDLNDSTHSIICGTASADFIYLGTRAPAGQRARIHQWNGSSTSVTDTFEIPAEAVLAMTIKDNVPWLFDSNGVLRALNGGAFVEVDRIPFKDGKPIRPLSGSQTTWMCHYNGMDSDKENIYLNLNTTYADGTTDERCPSGIWKYHERTGLHHWLSYGSTKSGGTITDYGAAKVSAIGAIKVAKVNDSTTNGTILAGATIFTNASSTTVGIFYDDSNDTLQKAGSFVTAKTFSKNVTENWNKLVTRFRKFLSSSDKIVVKYRVDEDEPTEATITYTSTTTFTVPTSSFTTAPVVGDEVEILQGVGGGRCAHISAISSGGGNYTVTVDETITGATTQTAKARFQTWRKITSFSGQNDRFKDFPLDNIKCGASPWVQFKIWFLWTGDNELYDLITAESVNQKIE